jgi:hypothetical protein
MKLTQITTEAGNTLWHACIPGGTAAKSLRSRTEAVFGNTINSKSETPVSYARYLRDFPGEFSNLPLISSLLSSVSMMHFNSSFFFVQ